MLSTDDVSIPATDRLEGQPTYVAPVETTEAKDKVPKTIETEEKPRAELIKRVLKPQDHELAVKVVIPDHLVRSLVDYPEVAWGLKQDIAHALAVRADAAFLHGTAADHAPYGIASTAAVKQLNHNADLLQTIRIMVGKLRRRDQVRFGNAGWILHPNTLDGLTRLLTDDVQQQGWPGRSLDSMGSSQLLSLDGHDGGTLLGYPFVVTSAAADDGVAKDGETPEQKKEREANDKTRIHFSTDWSEAWIAAEPPLVTVDVSVDAHFQSDETVVRAVMHHDFLVRRPSFFIYANRKYGPEGVELAGGVDRRQALPAADILVGLKDKPTAGLKDAGS